MEYRSSIHLYHSPVAVTYLHSPPPQPWLPLIEQRQLKLLSTEIAIKQGCHRQSRIIYVHRLSGEGLCASGPRSTRTPRPRRVRPFRRTPVYKGIQTARVPSTPVCASLLQGRGCEYNPAGRHTERTQGRAHTQCG